MGSTHAASKLVRATAHASLFMVGARQAMIRPEANGKRFILDGNEPPIPVNALIAKVRLAHHDHTTCDLIISRAQAHGVGY